MYQTICWHKLHHIIFSSNMQEISDLYFCKWCLCSKFFCKNIYSHGRKMSLSTFTIINFIILNTHDSSSFKSQTLLQQGLSYNLYWMIWPMYHSAIFPIKTEQWNQPTKSVRIKNFKNLSFGWLFLCFFYPTFYVMIIILHEKELKDYVYKFSRNFI